MRCRCSVSTWPVRVHQVARLHAEGRGDLADRRWVGSLRAALETRQRRPRDASLFSEFCLAQGPALAKCFQPWQSSHARIFYIVMAEAIHRCDKVLSWPHEPIRKGARYAASARARART